MGNFGGSRARHLAGSVAEGAVQGNSAKSAKIQRNRHLVGREVRNSDHRESAAFCVEISPWRPDGGSRSRHPAGSAWKGRDSVEFRQTFRNSAESPLTGAGMVGFRTPRIGGRLRKNIYTVSWEIPAARGPPTGRFCGEVARFGEISPDLQKFGEIATYLRWKGGLRTRRICG